MVKTNRWVINALAQRIDDFHCAVCTSQVGIGGQRKSALQRSKPYLSSYWNNKN